MGMGCRYYIKAVDKAERGLTLLKEDRDATATRSGSGSPDSERSAETVEEGRGESADDAGRGQIGADEYAVGVPALPDARGYSSSTAAAHPAGAGGANRKRAYSGRGFRTLSGVCGKPSPRVHAASSTR